MCGLWSKLSLRIQQYSANMNHDPCTPFDPQRDFTKNKPFVGFVRSSYLAYLVGLFYAFFFFGLFCGCHDAGQLEIRHPNVNLGRRWMKTW